MSAADLPPQLRVLAAVWAGLVGAALGSFLNVVIARVPAGESVVRPGSRCPRCGTPIRWYDNLPIASWVWLRARCRACGGRISARYPLVEALGAAVALVAFARHGLSLAGAAEVAFAAALVALAFIDLDTWLLPNAITWPLIAFGLVVGALGLTPAASLRTAAYGAGIGFAAFGLLWLFAEKVLKREALGFGDVWLLAALGGWEGPAALLPIVLLASIQGSVVGIVLIVLGKAQTGERPLTTSTSAPTTTPTANSTTTVDDTVTTSVRPERSEAESKGEPPEADWTPPRHAVPFGPFLVAGALEWLWLSGLLARAVPVLGVFR